MIDEILTGVLMTQENTHMSKWEEGKGKRVQHLINKWINQNKTVGGEM
jgi:hypothetical protein